jgi:sRNA-binding regulator protein Hfq
MKQILFILAFAIMPTLVFGQSDQIFLHNGETIKGKVSKVLDQTVVFIYDGEDAEQTLGKFAVEKIIYGKSGRSQEISTKFVVNGEADWANVTIIESLDAVAGLKRVGEIKGQTAFINFRTGAGSDKKAEEKLKKAAAEMKCSFILLTSDKDIDRKGASGGGFGQVQTVKKGIGYSY